MLDATLTMQTCSKTEGRVLRLSPTRLLILGVLRKIQPVSGYGIGKELESWHADRWANIAYGSIYHALSRMVEEGLIDKVEVLKSSERRQAKSTYEVTERGEAEFQTLLREQWQEVVPLRDPFQVALTFMDSLPRDELLTLLNHRAAQIRLSLDASGWISRLKSPPSGEILENMRLYEAYVRAELQWTEEAIGKVERGELP